LWQQQWMHMQAQRGKFREREGRPTPQWCSQQVSSAMDVLTGYTRGCLVAAEHILDQYATKPPFPPHAEAQQQCHHFSNVLSCLTSFGLTDQQDDMFQDFGKLTTWL
jgi:hypothetical protein